MDEEIIFSDAVNIWDAYENGRVKIGIKMCRDP
jgi:hypothetical protein